MKLFCAIVGVAGSAFSVEVGEDQTVDDSKLAIKNQKPNDLKDVDREKLQLFLAKQPVEGDEGKEVVPVYHRSAEEMKEESFKWLPDEHRAALKLVKGESDDYINSLTAGEQILASKTFTTWLFKKNKMELPSNEQIHVLVVVPDPSSNAALEYKDPMSNLRKRGAEVMTDVVMEDDAFVAEENRVRVNRVRCIIVGIAGQSFCINIESNARVENLQGAKKSRCRQRLKDVEADDLLIFLAEKADGAWLSADGAF
eukprot:jgi/Phyca11/576081/estExt2_Genewise1.C_PHYCAscaffold_830013